MCTLLTGWVFEAILAAPVQSEPGWHALPNAPALPQSRFDDVWFLDEQIGWTGQSGYVYRTVDGGTTWQSIAVPMQGIRCLAFATATKGWAGSVVDSIALWATADSGTTWSPVELPAPKPHGLCGLSIVNPSVIYGTGAWYGSPTVVKTVDGGASWTSMDLSAVATGLMDCHFFTPDSGFVVGRTGTGWLTDWRERVLFTGDGGTTWETRYSGSHAESWCWKISFPSRRVGYVSVESYGRTTSTRCLKTEDGGRTWSEVVVSAQSGIFLQGVGFVTESLGWACGSGRPGIYRTTDGGLTWEPAPWGERVNRIRFLGPKCGFAAGETIYKYSDPTAVERTNLTNLKRKWR